MNSPRKTDRYKTHLSLLLRLTEGSRRYFVASILFAWLTSILDLINPRIIAFAVDSVLGNTRPDLPSPLLSVLDRIGGTGMLRPHLWMVALAVIAIAVLAGLTRYTFRMMNARGQEKMLRETRNLLYSHIVSLPLTWHNQHHTGDIIQRCTSDVDVVRAFLSEHLISLIHLIAQILLALVFMLSISPLLTLAEASFIPLIVLFSYFFHIRIARSFRKVDEMEGQLSAIAQENLTGVRVVRAFGRELYERKRFEEKNEAYTGLWDHLMHLLSLFWATGDGLSGLQYLLILVVGARFCLSGSITVGSYIAFLSYSTMISGPVRQLGRIISGMSRAGVSIDRIRYILNAEPETETEPVSPAPMDGDITFDHVRFRYAPGDAPVLDDVSFTCKAGQVTGILGSTGSGKSTLMYLLCRLYDLPEDGGEIRIGGRRLSGISRRDVRNQIGIVLQEPYLFSRTLGENIAIAGLSASEANIREAAKVAVLEETVNRFTKGYDTFVGERGVTLSGGQKQRTAIAQTLIRNTPIMILDDSLSAVDTETDIRIRQELDRMDSKATRILIAHRITSLMHADHIVVLDRGKVVEEGTHEELMQRNGLYRRICDLQSPDNVTE
ncbi:MAG: ABC transporter ATP-binding protein [Clostridia bacterium]|nr:ABC transporter ATP-binding protein [Clostridia bacterium]